MLIVISNYSGSGLDVVASPMKAAFLPSVLELVPVSLVRAQPGPLKGEA
jgi:hypothetical protein